MNLISKKSIISFLILLLPVAVLPNTTLAQDQNKPLLSKAIHEVIESNGIDTAKKQFLKLDQTQRERYNTDMEGISDLINSYIEAGNYEVAAALSEITAPFMQDIATRAMNEYAPEMADMMAEQQQEETERRTIDRETGKERHERERQDGIAKYQGEPREDLERFTGLYADSDAENSRRQLWVTVSCDGYLVSGARWGDVAPWWMRSEDDHIFTLEDSFNNVRMEFTTDSGGNAIEMNHNLDFLKSPLERIGDLPDDWDSCMERMRR